MAEEEVTRRVRALLPKLVKTVAKGYQPEKIILFGSYASGSPTEESDLDLLIIKETRQPFFRRLVMVRRLVSDVRRGYPFDPLVVTPSELKRRLAKGDQFFADILTRGRVLYARA